MALLELRNLVKTFGGLTATNNVSFSVQAGERRAVIGPNGAGKTTLFNLITGTLPVTSGEILLKGKSVTELKTFERVRRGMGRTFQRNNLFLNLSVFENVRLAVQREQGVSFGLLRPAGIYREVNERSAALLEQVGLAGLGEASVNTIAYGQQRALEVALALASKPDVLLLDEPTAGMSPAETGDIVRLVQSLDAGLTLLIIEHDMNVIFDLADTITVLHYGELLTEGTPAEVQANENVQRVYLGEELTSA